MFVRSLPNEEQKTKLVLGVFDAFATHAGLVYDVAGIDCWAQNGGSPGRVFATFMLRRFITNRIVGIYNNNKCKCSVDL